MRVLLWSDGGLKPRKSINFMLLSAALAMFLFGTMDIAFGLRHNLDAFIYYDGNPIDEFANTSYWVNVMKMGNYVAQTFVGDSILLYRLWIIWEKSWLMMIGPAILWLAETVCGAMTIYIEATLKSNTALLNAGQLQPFITGMLTLTLTTNLITTSLIVYRIWSIQASVQPGSILYLRNGPLTSLVRVLVESGLMYTFSIVVLFILYMFSNNGQFGVSDSVVQIIGITFNLIITSVDRGSTISTMNFQSTGRSHFMTNIASSPRTLEISVQKSTSSRGYPYDDEEIAMDKEAHVDVERRLKQPMRSRPDL